MHEGNYDKDYRDNFLKFSSQNWRNTLGSSLIHKLNCLIQTKKA